MTWRAVWVASFTLAACLACPSRALAQGPGVATVLNAKAGSDRDGVYDRLDGDLDLALALGAEFGSAGTIAPAARGSAHFFSIAGVYAAGRAKAGHDSAPSLFDLGVDLRPLFVPRWAKGYETGPAFFDLTLDSLSLSLGAFWSAKEEPRASARGFEAELGFGLPLGSTAAGPWFEAYGILRYPDSGPRQEAALVLLAWHGFVTSPVISWH